MNGHCKPFYYEILSNINQASSKYLFRYLMLFENMKFIFVNYSVLADMLSLKRRTKRSQIIEQIGEIARHINNEIVGDVLLYTSTKDDGINGKNYPFLFDTGKEKGDYVFTFSLTSCLSPYTNKEVKSLAVDMLKEKEKREWILYNEAAEAAKDSTMSLEELTRLSHYHDYSGATRLIILQKDKNIKNLQKKAIEAKTIGNIVMINNPNVPFVKLKYDLENQIAQKQQIPESSDIPF